LKRIFDIIAVALVLPAILPVMGVLVFFVRRDSPGPVFFKQQRIGFLGKPFRVYKFRSMVQNAETLGSSVTAREDPRITPLGRVLRKTKLDELPQLLNVFIGDMSLVGPRPEVSEIVQTYSLQMKRIFLIRPGITSVATLHLKDEESLLSSVSDPDRFYEEVLVPLKVGLAMEHVDRKSFAFDLKILCQTLWMVTLGRWWPIREHPAVSGLRQLVTECRKQEVSEKEAFGGCVE
jgi:lipopolysaccharide/colanic/teichoic acid biosynthesis glycosyltransferase